MKKVTTWASNTKQLTGWQSTSQKSTVSWSPKDTRVATTVTVTPRTPTTWGRTSQPAQGYPYDDATVPYDSPLFEYDFLVNNNTSNQLLQTRWAAN